MPVGIFQSRCFRTQQPAQKLKTDARGNCSRFTQMNAEERQMLSSLFWLEVQALAAAPTLSIFSGAGFLMLQKLAQFVVA